MLEYLLKFQDKFKSFLSLLGTIALSIIGYKILTQDRKIKDLESDLDQATAENDIKEKQGELNEIKSNEKIIEKKFKDANDAYKHSKSELDNIRKHRPE